MVINWKPCQKCKEEFLKLMDGMCSKCGGWDDISYLAPKTSRINSVPLGTRTWHDRRDYERRAEERRSGERREFDAERPYLED